MNAVVKWTPVLQISNINKEYWNMVARYCEMEYIKDMDHDKNLLPIQLKILSKIDLSRVVLCDDKIEDDIFKTYEITVRISQSEMMDVSKKIGIDIIDKIEHALIEDMSHLYNKMINDKSGVIIKTVGMGMEHDFDNNKITLKSRFISLGEYRQLKLKKISERN